MSDAQQQPLVGNYTGTTRDVLGLSLKTTLLTLITLGIYRFWARTRIRRFVWSATAPGGDPFEYTGTGLEKLLGFLIAIVILAAVLGLMQLGLFFVGLSFFDYASDEMAELYQLAAFQTSLLVIVPLILIARYRGRRYMMSRTRWRGIRFGMEAASLGYMLRYIGHALLTVLTLGLLLPRQTYYLNKYMMDRTWYGDQPFEVQGSWTRLFRAMLHLAIGVVLVIAAVAVSVAFAANAPMDDNFEPVLNPGQITVMIGLGGIGYLWMIFGFIHYRVRSFALLTSMTRLGRSVTFSASPSTGTVIWKVIGGTLLVTLIAGASLVALFFVVVGMAHGGGPLATIVMAVGYIVVISFANALTMAFVVQPVIRHFVTRTEVTTPAGLAAVRQRAQDDFADADGFADALDVGAAI